MAPAPGSLRPIQPYLAKAEEMKNADPIVAYYCKYWAVQYAISLGLKDPETNVFLSSLLDSLEKEKVSMSTTEAIIDDVVGRAYMENFAGNIFARADDEERAKKATRATAVKFFAASQFMEVLQCFGDLDSETKEKIKYAKFQCGRIMKALKAGEDPNAGTPEIEDAAIPVVPYVSPSTNPPQLRPPDDGIPSTQPTNQNPSAQLHSPGTSVPPPLVPTRPSPPVSFTPSNDSQSQPLFPPGPPSVSNPSPLRVSPPAPVQPSSPGTFPPPSIRTYPYTSRADNQPPPNQFAPPPPPRPSQYPPSQPQETSNYYSPQAPPPQQRLPPSATTANYYSNQPSAPRQPAVQSPSYFPSQTQVLVDDDAIAKAQKHARWAISALNYEDVETAIKELRNALSTLGAT